MTDFSAGSASISIRPNLDNFVRELETKLERIDASFAVDVTPNLDGFAEKVKADLDRIDARISVPITPDLDGFAERVKADLDRIDARLKVVIESDWGWFDLEFEAKMREYAEKRLSIHVDVDDKSASVRLDELARDRHSKIKVSVDKSDLSTVEKAFGAVKSVVSGFGQGFMKDIGPDAMNAAQSVAQMGATAAVSKPALIALGAVTLTPLVASASQALGVIALIPAAAAAAGAGLGALMVGSHGVLEAIQAGTKASNDASNAAKMQADAQDQLTSAQENVAKTAENGATQIESAERAVQSAQRNSTQAQQELTQARQDAVTTIRNLNEELRGSVLNEKQAELDVRKAYQALLKAQAPGNSQIQRDQAGLDYQKSLYNLEQAKQKQSDLQKQTDKANHDGVEGAKNVVAAKQKVADTTQAQQVAEENLAKTRHDAAQANSDAARNLAKTQRDLAEALKGNTQSMTAYDQALSKLAPSAREFVTQLKAMGSQFSDLQQQVQQNLFEGLASSFSQLSGYFLPTIKQGLSDVASGINVGVRGALAGLQTDSMRSDFANIFKNAAASMPFLIDGFKNIAQAFGDISSVGSDFLPGLSKGFDNATKKFADFITKVKDNGELHEFIQKSIDKFKELVDIIKSIGQIIGDIFRGANAPQGPGKQGLGDDWLKNMQDTFERWHKFLASDEGQQKIKSFFQEVKTIVDGIVKGIQLGAKILGMFNPGHDSDPNNPGGTKKDAGSLNRVWNVQHSDSWEGKVSRGFNSFLGYDSDHNRWSMSAMPQWEKDLNFISPLSRWIKNDHGNGLGHQMAGVLNDFGVGGASRWLSNANGDGLKHDVGGVGRWLSNDNGNGAWGGIQSGWDHLTSSISSGWDNTIRPRWDALTKKVQDIGSNFADHIKNVATGAWNGLTNGVSSGWHTISDKWGQLTGGAKKLADSFLSNITNGAVTHWSDLPSKIGDAVSNIVDKFFPGLKSGLDDLKNHFGSVVDGIGKVWDGLRDKMSTPINWVIDHVLNNGIGKAWNLVRKVLPSLPDWPTVPHIDGKADGGPVVPGRAQGGSLVPVSSLSNPNNPIDITRGGELPAASKNRDSTLFAGKGDEYVLTGKMTDQVGVDNLERWRLSGGGPEGMFAGLADGGSVDAAKRFAQSQSGKPYQYGGTGDPSWDCSGFMGGIWAVLNDITPYARYFNTESDFGALGFKSGLGDPFSIGIMHGGGGENSHMAGTLDGVNVESNGTDGVEYGGSARGANDGLFDTTWHWEMAGHNGNVFTRGLNAVKHAIGGVMNGVRQKVADIFEKPLRAIGSKIPNFGDSGWGQLPRALYSTLVDQAIDLVRGKSGASGSAGSGPGAEQWRSLAMQAMARTGFDPNNPDQVEAMLRQIMSESSGQSGIVQQVHDVNSGGNEAVGLLQVTPGTFEAYRDKSLPDDRTNPLANMVAALNDYRSNYGDDLTTVWGHGHGYDQGGIANGIGFMPKMTLQPERVLSPKQTAAFDQLVASITGQTAPGGAQPVMPGSALPGDPTDANGNPITYNPADAQSPGGKALAAGYSDLSPQDFLASTGQNFATKGLGILGSGLLGFFGLDNSVLSPSNTYNQAWGQLSQVRPGPPPNVQSALNGMQAPGASVAQTLPYGGTATLVPPAPVTHDNSVSYGDVHITDLQELMSLQERHAQQQAQAFMGVF